MDEQRICEEKASISPVVGNKNDSDYTSPTKPILLYELGHANKEIFWWNFYLFVIKRMPKVKLLPFWHLGYYFLKVKQDKVD